MSNDIARQERSYRRGLVLGLTMAEITLLLLFILLLTLCWSLDKHKSDKEKLINKINYIQNKYKESNTKLREIREVIDQNVSSNFDDYFRELKIVKQKASKVSKLQDKAKIAKAALNALNLNNATPKQVHDMIKEDQKILNNIRREFKTLKGQQKNLKKKLKSIGCGTEMPACWADPKTGKPEYIFNIVLTSNGLIIKNNALKHRKEEQRKLPIEQINYDQELSINQFKRQTQPIYRWSKKNKCRFFVRAIDATRPNEKRTYKKHMRVLEEHFYKLIVK